MATARTSDDGDGSGDAHDINNYTFAYIIMPEVVVRVFAFINRVMSEELRCAKDIICLF